MASSLRLYAFTSLLLHSAFNTQHSALSQQLPQYSQYVNNQFLLNPALAGTALAPEARAGFRAQWAGIQEAPRSVYLSAHMPVGRLPSRMQGRVRGQASQFHGVGVLVRSDAAGPLSRTGIYLAYAYNQALTDKLRGALGLFAGVQQFALNETKLRFADPTTATLSGFSRVLPDGGVGGWLYAKRWWAGASIQQVLRNQFSTYDYTKGFYRAERHFYLNGGYSLPVDKDWVFVPSLLVKWVSPAPVSFDLNAKLRHKNDFFAGVSFRRGDAVGFMAGLTAGKAFDFGYCYDASFSNLGRLSAGSHEVFLGCRFVEANRRKVYNPSDFWR